MNDPGLKVTHNEKIIFSVDGKWLHPLFELEEFLSAQAIDPAELKAEDKIIGKAAAMLMVRMGLRTVHGRLMSRLALGVFEDFGVACTHDVLVPRIDCQTEEILANIDDPEEASVFLLRRGKRAVDAALIVESLDVSLGGRPVLKNLSFAVTRGEKVIIRGPNGSGKSTLLKAVLGEVPALGERFLFGQKEMTPDLLGYLGQETGVEDLSITAGEIVELGTCGARLKRADRDARISEALDLTGSLNLKHRPLKELSGGERRRVDLARCFAQSPRLLLLDEPTANLDPDSREQIIQILGTYGQLQRSTIIMVTHDTQTFDLPGWRYHEMRDGRLHPLGTKREHIG